MFLKTLRNNRRANLYLVIMPEHFRSPWHSWICSLLTSLRQGPGMKRGNLSSIKGPFPKARAGIAAAPGEPASWEPGQLPGSGRTGVWRGLLAWSRHPGISRSRWLLGTAVSCVGSSNLHATAWGLEHFLTKRYRACRLVPLCGNTFPCFTQ